MTDTTTPVADDTTTAPDTTPVGTPVDIDVPAIVAAYVAANVTGKAYMRAMSDLDMGNAIDRDDFDRVRALRAAHVAMMSARAVTVVDYAATIADMRATLITALAVIRSGDYVVPDGGIVGTLADDYVPNVDADMVARLTTTTGRKSGRGDVAAYVALALADMDTTVTVARVSDIRRFRGGDYADAAPSAGAVTAYYDRIVAGTNDAPTGWSVGTNAAGTAAWLRNA